MPRPTPASLLPLCAALGLAACAAAAPDPPAAEADGLVIPEWRTAYRPFGGYAMPPTQPKPADAAAPAE